MRTRTAYYKVFASKDGTIFLTMPTRKPRQTRHGPAPAIDEDGICTWYEQDDDEVRLFTEWGKGAWHTALSTSLNVKRILRSQIEPRLQRLEEAVAAVQTHLEQINSKLDRLVSGRGSGQPG